MKDLRKLFLISNKLRHSGIIKLIEKSPKICEIQMNVKFINLTTINALIKKSEKDPKTRFKLIANDIKNNLELRRITDADIPENLLVESFTKYSNNWLNIRRRYYSFFQFVFLNPLTFKT
jgi:hypothetical protein